MSWFINMSTNSATKYVFDTEFASDGTILRDGDSYRMHFTREEMQIERDKAFAEGQQAALVKAEEQSCAHLKALCEQSTQILSTFKAHSDECRSQAIDLVLVAARKIAGTALEQYPDERVQGVVGDVLKDLRGAARLVIICPEGVSDAAKQGLQDLAKDNDFNGALVFRCAENAEPGDVVLEWAQGEICVNTAEIADRVESTVRHWLSATQAQESQYDLFAAKNDSEEGK